MEWGDLIERTAEVLEKEPRLIHLPPRRKVVFVGDTHGDHEATERVVSRYLKKSYRIVFLGDYVDRGYQSEENIHYLFKMKLSHPEDIYLLAGNHEGFRAKRFYPANFWESLPEEEIERFGRLFEKLPLVTSSENGLLALHGALPDLPSLEMINQIQWGDDHWNRITWGDFVESETEVLGDWGGRPQFGAPYFRRVMDRFQKKVLIRSHQPHCPQQMFNKRCITIFTSNAYLSTRTIAIVDLEKEVRTAKEVVLSKV